MYRSIDVTGVRDPRQRGEIYGGEAKAEISYCAAVYARMFAYCGIAWSDACQKGAAYRSVLQRMDPDLLPEVEGIASGCGRQLDEILAINCRSEILPGDFRVQRERTVKALREGANDERDGQALAALDANRRAGVERWLDEGGECTTMGVSGRVSRDGDTWLAQNWDMFSRLRDTLVILKFTHRDGMRVNTLTEAGMLAKIGFNSAGLAIGLSILRTEADGKRVGVPTHPLLRCLHTCRSVAEVRQAMDRFATIGFSGSSNVPCADASGEVGSMEYTPQGWAEWQAKGGVFVHANHFLCTEHQPLEMARGGAPSTRLRQHLAEEILGRNPPDFTTLQTCLFDESQGQNSICRPPDPNTPLDGRGESITSVIINVSKKSWWIASNPPQKKEFDFCGQLTQEVGVEENV